jgi:hypothetical protein
MFHILGRNGLTSSILAVDYDDDDDGDGDGDGDVDDLYFSSLP